MIPTDPLLRERAARIRLLVLDVDGVLTDGRLYFDTSGNEFKTFCTRDGLGIKALKRCGIELAIITGRASPIVRQRASQLGIGHVYEGSDDKLAAYMDLLDKTGVEEAEVCYAGDDWIDLPVLLRVGLAVAVPNADPEVRKRVHWVTNAAGGEGAVREICDLILDARGHRETLLQEFLEQ